MKKTLVAMLFVMAILVSGHAYAASITIDIPLPKIVLAAPPALVVIPGTYVYLAPEVEIDMFFYGGYWYQLHEGRWFRSLKYSGPWRKIALHKLPAALRKLPPGYRKLPFGERLRHEDVKKHWRKWERARHWDKPKHAPPPPPPPAVVKPGPPPPPLPPPIVVKPAPAAATKSNDHDKDKKDK